MGIKSSCTGDHRGLDSTKLRSHYSAGCRDALTRAAINAYQAELRTRRNAGDDSRPRATTAPVIERQPTNTGPEAYVDHFKAAAAAAAGLSGVNSAPTNAVKAAAAAEAKRANEAAVAPKPTPRPAPAQATSTVSSIGACRRLRSLVRIGHTPSAIAGELNVHEGTIWWLLLWPQDQIKATTHAAIATVYQRLRNQPQQGSGPHAERAQALAERQDWPTPFAFENIDTDPSPTPDRNEHSTSSVLRSENELLRGKLAEANRNLTALKNAAHTAPTGPAADELQLELLDAREEIQSLRAALDFNETRSRARHRADTGESADLTELAALFHIKREPTGNYSLRVAAGALALGEQPA